MPAHLVPEREKSRNRTGKREGFGRPLDKCEPDTVFCHAVLEPAEHVSDRPDYRGRRYRLRKFVFDGSRADRSRCPVNYTARAALSQQTNGSLEFFLLERYLLDSRPSDRMLMSRGVDVDIYPLDRVS